MLLRLENIGKTFGSEQIIKNFNMDINTGEYISILGSSGCGKTTLLKIIAGLLQPEFGKIERQCKRLGFVFQDDRLIPWRNVLRNVSIVSDSEKALKYLKAVGLNNSRTKYPFQLSGGMRRRVNIARAMAYEPDIILMDEPFSSLDIVTREKVMNLISDIWNKENIAVLMVTHDPFEAAALSTRIAVVNKGFDRYREFQIGHPSSRSTSDNAKLASDLMNVLREFYEDELDFK